jgi:hypothetical protein
MGTRRGITGKGCERMPPISTSARFMPTSIRDAVGSITEANFCRPSAEHREAAFLGSGWPGHLAEEDPRESTRYPVHRKSCGAVYRPVVRVSVVPQFHSDSPQRGGSMVELMVTEKRMKDRPRTLAPSRKSERNRAAKPVALALTAALAVLAIAAPSWADGANWNHQQGHHDRDPRNNGRYHPVYVYRAPPRYVYAPPSPPPAFVYPAPPPGYVYAPPPNGYIYAPPPPRFDYAPPPPGYVYVRPRPGLSVVVPFHVE